MPQATTLRRLAVVLAAGLIGWQAVGGMIALVRDGLAPPTGFRFGDERGFAAQAFGEDLPIYEAMLAQVPVDATLVFVLELAALGEQERAERLERAMNFRYLAWPRRCLAPKDLRTPEIAQQLAQTTSYVLVFVPGAADPVGHELLARSGRMALYRRPEGLR